MNAPAAPACMAASRSVAPSGKRGSRNGWCNRSRVASASSDASPDDRAATIKLDRPTLKNVTAVGAQRDAHPAEQAGSHIVRVAFKAGGKVQKLRHRERTAQALVGEQNAAG